MWWMTPYPFSMCALHLRSQKEAQSWCPSPGPALMDPSLRHSRRVLLDRSIPGLYPGVPLACFPSLPWVVIRCRISDVVVVHYLCSIVGPNTAAMVEYLHKMKWRTPFLRRLRSLSRQWKMAIDSLDCTIFFDFSSCCQSGSGIQPRKSFRLGLIRDGRLICHNRKAYERLKWDDALLSGDHTPDRGISLHFGRTGVFQWNYPNLSTMTQTTEWPQKVSGHTLQNCDIGGLTHTRVDPQPHMPYVIFRHMGPHFDSYANSGIPRH